MDREIILAQSAVGPAYEAMLDASRLAHTTFCKNNDVDFRTYANVMRGFHPWQACYNRILILADLLQSGFRGWFMHLDADAIIRHPQFDIRTFFGKREAYGLIAVPSSPGVEDWNINDGVFFLNFADERGRGIISRWHSEFMALSDDALRSAAVPWQYPDGSPFPGDQHLLQMVLKRDPVLLGGLSLEEPLLMNHRGAKFIRQYLRAHGAPEERLAWIEEAAASCSC
jgi:hypothetical protein